MPGTDSVDTLKKINTAAAIASDTTPKAEKPYHTRTVVQQKECSKQTVHTDS